MKRLLFSLVAASTLVLATPLAQGIGPADETRITLRHEFLRLINDDRERNGLRPVELDPEASAIGDAYCRQQIQNGTSGHFTTDGLAPYMRYSFNGGSDGLSENAAAWTANYRFSDRALYDMIVRSEQAMIRERPPNDGHRRTILDPNATHVGIGLAWERGEFRIAQEFIRRYVTWKWPVPRVVAPGERVTAAGKPLDGYRVDAISVHHEPLPRPITAAVANARDSYGLPEARRDYLPRLRTYFERRNGSIVEVKEEYVDGRRGDFTIATDRSFSFEVPFNDGPGIYTLVVWVRRGDAGAPIPASNISIRVDSTEPASGYSVRGTR